MMNVSPTNKKRFHERCLDFGVAILRLTSALRQISDLKSIAEQLSRSATSCGANAQEARSAESRADFIHKMHIALKEMRESGYWLALIMESALVQEPGLEALRRECSELTAILVASVRTAQANAKREKKQPT